MGSNNTIMTGQTRSRRKNGQRSFHIRGAIVPPGSLPSNEKHTWQDNSFHGQREAFLEELSVALSELESDEEPHDDVMDDIPHPLQTL